MKKPAGLRRRVARYTRHRLIEGYRRQVKKRFRGLSASKNEDVTRTNLDPAIYRPLTVLGTRLIAEIRWLAATGRGGRVAERNWTIRPADGITAASILEPARSHETVSAQAIHMVERADLRHAIVDMAVRRAGRRRRAGQPVLPHPRRQD